MSALILGGDFFTGSVLSSALTKLVLRYDELASDRRKSNALRAEVSRLVHVSEEPGQSSVSSDSRQCWS